MIKAVVYDFDNTLVDSAGYVERVLLEAVAVKYGWPSGIDENELLKSLRDIQKSNCSFEEIFNRLFQEEGPDVLAAYRDIAKNKPYQATPGAFNLVSYCADKGYIQGVLTNRTKMLQQRLQEAELDVMTFLLMPPSKELRKPSPRAFDPVIELLKGHNISPEEIMSIGNHTDDYISANKAGIHFCAVTSGTCDEEDFEKAGLEKDLSFDSLDGVLKYIQNMEE